MYVIELNFIVTGLWKNYWWIGGRKINNTWQWVTRLYPSYAVTFTYWTENEPNNQGGNEDCMEVYTHEHSFKWSDIPCSYKKPYICETHYSNVFG